MKKKKPLDDAAAEFIKRETDATGRGISLQALATRLHAVGYLGCTRYVVRRIISRLIKRGIVCKDAAGHAMIEAAKPPNRQAEGKAPESAHVQELEMWEIKNVNDLEFESRQPETMFVDQRFFRRKLGKNHFLVRINSRDYTGLRVKTGGIFLVRRYAQMPTSLRGIWCLVRIHENVGLRRVRIFAKTEDAKAHVEKYETSKHAIIRRFRAKGGVELTEEEMDKHLHIYGAIEGAFCPGVGTNMKELYAEARMDEANDEPFTSANAYSY